MRKSSECLGIVFKSMTKGRRNSTVGKGLKEVKFASRPASLIRAHTNLTHHFGKGCSPKTKSTISGNTKLGGSLQKLIIPSGGQGMDSSLRQGPKEANDDSNSQRTSSLKIIQVLPGLLIFIHLSRPTFITHTLTHFLQTTKWS